MARRDPFNMRLPEPILDAIERVRVKQVRTKSNLVLRYIIEGLVRDGEYLTEDFLKAVAGNAL